MSITPLLTRKLQEALGLEAAEDLVAWMDRADTHRGDVAELRHEMRMSFARMDTAFAKVEALVERRISDLMKWSFVFWCGAVAAIAALAGVLK